MKSNSEMIDDIVLSTERLVRTEGVVVACHYLRDVLETCFVEPLAERCGHPDNEPNRADPMMIPNDLYDEVGWIETHAKEPDQSLVPKDWRYTERSVTIMMGDLEGDLVPLPARASREDPPFVPNKFGEHD